MSAIKAGDLVMVVRPTACCGNAGWLGLIFTVLDVLPAATHACPYCHTVWTNAFALSVGKVGLGFPISRLTKIDPPAVPQEVLEEVSA